MNLNSQSIISAIAHFAVKSPNQTALQGKALENKESVLSYAELAMAIEQTSLKLKHSTAKVLGLAMDNSLAWAIIDLAAMQSSIPVVPLPYFFSAEQIIHAIDDAGINVLLSDQPILFEQLLSASSSTSKSHGIKILHKTQYLVGDKVLTEFTLSVNNASVLPTGTAKITYTSGTTGKPKGVCLDAHALNQVARSLLQATDAAATDRHLSILPLSTLLENIAGLYVPLLAGATTTLLPAAQVGLTGATGLNIATMMAALNTSKATTTVLTPELLTALVSAIEAGYPKPPCLRFVAVGGASVAPQLLKRACAVGLPVYEGYGLSECASVVALNTPLNSKLGSVGKPLPHVTIKFAEDGEILVKGACLLGYASNENIVNDTQATQYWPTGDIGHFDDEGYLYITARKKNQFITSFGRNVAPEWVERELTLSPFIAQAAIFGEARPWNVAVIFPAKNATPAEIDISIAEINQTLPDYARVSQWLLADSPFTPQNGQLTANGRLRRDLIWQQYQSRINEKYKGQAYAVL
ncbi:MAG: AMP-binding protein [Methylotenera sp.]